MGYFGYAVNTIETADFSPKFVNFGMNGPVANVALGFANISISISSFDRSDCIRNDETMDENGNYLHHEGYYEYGLSITSNIDDYTTIEYNSHLYNR